MKIEEKNKGYHVVADEGKALKHGDDYFGSAFLPKSIDLAEIVEVDESEVPQDGEGEELPPEA